jgi:hypothetical protein
MIQHCNNANFKYLMVYLDIPCYTFHLHDNSFLFVMFLSPLDGLSLEEVQGM